MRLKEDIKPVAFLKARAVVLDIESYEALRDATLLLRIAAQGEADLQAGRFLPQDEAFARVRSRLKGQ